MEGQPDVNPNYNTVEEKPLNQTGDQTLIDPEPIEPTLTKDEETEKLKGNEYNKSGEANAANVPSNNNVYNSSDRCDRCGDCGDCCEKCCKCCIAASALSLTTILALALFLALYSLQALFIFAFIWYKVNRTTCQSTLYEKIQPIIIIGMVWYGLGLVFRIVSNCLQSLKQSKLAHFISLVISGLFISLTILIQVRYNQSKTWDDCGSLKTWTIVCLVFYWIGAVGEIIYFICTCCCGFAA